MYIGGKGLQSESSNLGPGMSLNYVGLPLVDSSLCFCSARDQRKNMNPGEMRGLYLDS